MGQKSWNNSVGAAQFSIFTRHSEKTQKNEVRLRIRDSRFYAASSVEETKNYLTKHFDQFNTTLGEYQKHAVGDVELPVGGLVDMIAESSTTKYKIIKIDKGDSYTVSTFWGGFS